MASVNINDIASQLNTASRLMVSTDFFWIYMANGSQVKIPAEFARAYLIAGIKPTINSNGHWEIGGEDLGVVAVGKTPQFRGGTMGIEVSYDNGQTWSQVVAYTDIDPDLEALAAAYTKVTQGEADRVKAENTRNSNETSRQNAETTRNNQEATRVSQETDRQSAETTRNANEETRKKKETTRQSQEAARVEAEKKRVTAENARATAESGRVKAETKRETDTKAAIASSKTQTDLAQELNDHPQKQGDNGNWWKWNTATKQYEDTGIIARGGMMYPTFEILDNELYVTDAGSNIEERIALEDNELILKL